MTPDAALEAIFPDLNIPARARAYILVESVKTNPDQEVVIALKLQNCLEAKSIKLRLPRSQARVLFGELGKELVKGPPAGS